MSGIKQTGFGLPPCERPGKIEVTSSKPCRTQRDLSLAYTLGLAVACLEIEKPGAREPGGGGEQWDGRAGTG